MKRKLIFNLLLIVFCSSLVNAIGVSYENYFDVNVTETVTLAEAGNTSNQTAFFYMNGTNYTMTKTTGQHYIYVSSAFEEDVPFNISLWESNLTGYNYSIANFSGLLLFRQSFNVTIELYTDRNETFIGAFDYVYLKNTSSLLQSARLTADVGATLSKYMSFGLIDKTPAIDLTTVFWGEVSGYSTTIKLYDVGNYSVNLLTMKTFKPNYWSYEFIKPQYTKSRVETVLDSNLNFDLKQNQDVKIYLSQYEANKWNYIFNIVKWVFMILLLFGGVVGAFVSGQPKMALAIIPIWFVLLKVFGLV